MSWEGFALEQVIQALGAEREACFWGSPSGAEVDLGVPRGGKLYGFECKYGDAPTVTKSMLVARRELALERLDVVHPGAREYELGDGIRAMPLARVFAELRGLYCPASRGARDSACEFAWSGGQLCARCRDSMPINAANEMSNEVIKRNCGGDS
jgi:hypothetical protein